MASTLPIGYQTILEDSGLAFILQADALHKAHSANVNQLDLGWWSLPIIALARSLWSRSFIHAFKADRCIQQRQFSNFTTALLGITNGAHLG